MDKPSKKVYDQEDKKPVDRSNLGKLEGGGGSSSTSSGSSFYKASPGSSTSTNAEANVDLKSQEASGGFYTPNTASSGEDSSNLFSRIKNIKITKRRAAAGGGVLGIIVGVFAFLNIAQGPFQFIHFAQLLQQFHFAGQEDMGDDRVSRLYRYARSGGDIKQTRVGYIGSAMAPRIEAKFARAGISVNYEGPSQIARSFEIDRTHPKWVEMSDEDLRAYANRNNINIEIDSGGPNDGRARVIIPTSIFARTGPVIRWALKESGTYKVVTPIQTRTFGKWAKVTWHPLRKVDAKINETTAAFYERIKERRDGTIRNGSVGVDARSSGSEDDPNETDEERENRRQNRETGSAAAQEAEALADEASEVGGETTERQSALSRLTENFRLKLIGGGALLTGAICTMYHMNEMFEALKLAKVILPLMRHATYAISTGNQVMGGVDAEAGQLGPLNESFHDPEEGSWLNSRTMQAEQGRPQTGPEVDSVLSFIPDRSPFWRLSNISGLGSLCSTVGQIIVAAITIVLTIFTGGGFGAASVAFSAIGGVAIDMVAMRLFAALFADVAVDSYIRGPGYADYANFGARLSANATGLSRGGAELTPAESDAIQVAVNQQYEREFASKSLAHRLFSPEDPKSAFAQLLDKPDPDLTGNIAKISNVFSNFGGYFSSASAAIFAPVRAQSAGGYDYGFPEYGFSISELENPIVENPYTNAEVVGATLSANPDIVPFLNEKIKKCFGAEIVRGSFEDQEVWQAKAVLGSEEDMPNPYDATSDDGYREAGCDDNTNEWTRIRFFVFDSVLSDSAYCYEMDDEEACRNVGFVPPPPPGGGIVDCNAPSGVDQSPGNPYETDYGDIIVAATQGLIFCPDWPQPPGAYPGTPGMQYYAYDGCSDDCGIQGQIDGKDYIRVTYRNPPAASNTLNIFVDGSGIVGGSGSGAVPPPGGDPPGGDPPPPPPCSGPFCPQ